MTGSTESRLKRACNGTRRPSSIEANYPGDFRAFPGTSLHHRPVISLIKQLTFLMKSLPRVRSRLFSLALIYHVAGCFERSAVDFEVAWYHGRAGRRSQRASGAWDRQSKSCPAVRWFPS